jgi:PAS domain S-box-containing protein
MSEPAGQVRPTAPTATPATGATVLIVDDEPLGRETVGSQLYGQGYQLAFATDGADALRQASVLQPDLILLDVMMPGMDGFEVCQRLRADPVVGEVPIIMLTALDDRKSLLRGIEAGADDFISKPFDRVELQVRVRTIVRLNRHRRLLAERDKLARLIEFAPDGLLIVDQGGTLVLANPAFVRMLNLASHDDLLGMPIASLIAPMRQAACQAALARVFAGETSAVRIESVLASPTGAQLPIELHIGAQWWNGEPAAQLIARDITERKQAELLEMERRQLAYDLHDGLMQTASSVYQHLQVFAARHRPRAPQTRAELDRIIELARRTVAEGRRMIAGLRPTALDDLGLTTALQMQVAALHAEGWDVQFQASLGHARIPAPIETVLYRVAQEALANIRKHARTTRAAVTLERGHELIRLVVQDWGCGFDVAGASASTSLGERMGLRGMHERVMLVGGHCDVRSVPKTGTTVVAEIPLAATGERKHST